MAVVYPGFMTAPVGPRMMAPGAGPELVATPSLKTIGSQHTLGRFHLPQYTSPDGVPHNADRSNIMNPNTPSNWAGTKSLANIPVNNVGGVLANTSSLNRFPTYRPPQAGGGGGGGPATFPGVNRPTGSNQPPFPQHNPAKPGARPTQAVQRFNMDAPLLRPNRPDAMQIVAAKAGIALGGPVTPSAGARPAGGYPTTPQRFLSDASSSLSNQPAQKSGVAFNRPPGINTQPQLTARLASTPVAASRPSANPFAKASQNLVLSSSNPPPGALIAVPGALTSRPMNSPDASQRIDMQRCQSEKGIVQPSPLQQQAMLAHLGSTGQINLGSNNPLKLPLHLMKAQNQPTSQATPISARVPGMFSPPTPPTPGIGNGVAAVPGASPNLTPRLNLVERSESSLQAKTLGQAPSPNNQSFVMKQHAQTMSASQYQMSTSSANQSQANIRLPQRSSSFGPRGGGAETPRFAGTNQPTMRPYHSQQPPPTGTLPPSGASPVSSRVAPPPSPRTLPNNGEPILIPAAFPTQRPKSPASAISANASASNLFAQDRSTFSSTSFLSTASSPTNAVRSPISPKTSSPGLALRAPTTPTSSRPITPTTPSSRTLDLSRKTTVYISTEGGVVSSRCPLCHATFSQGALAVTLNCRHTYCKACVDRDTINQRYRCPSCKVVTDLSNEKGPTSNFALGSLSSVPIRELKRHPTAAVLERMGAVCPVCFDSYANRTPVMLNCGHSMCEKCMQDIATYHHTTSVECPECRCHTDLRDKVDNVALQRAVQTVLQLKHSNATPSRASDAPLSARSDRSAVSSVIVPSKDQETLRKEKEEEERKRKEAAEMERKSKEKNEAHDKKKAEEDGRRKLWEQVEAEALEREKRAKEEAERAAAEQQEKMNAEEEERYLAKLAEEAEAKRKKEKEEKEAKLQAEAAKIFDFIPYIG